MSSTTTQYPAGVPCWIDTFQPEPEAAARFYGALLGWTFDAPVAMPGGLPGAYRVARLAGRPVAGVGQAPPGQPAAVWTTYVAVDDVAATVGRAAAAGGRCLAGPMPDGDGGAVAILADPAGVAFGIRGTGSPRCSARSDTPGAWAMSSLHTPAPPEAAAFYGALFGWRLAAAPEAPLAFWYAGDTTPDRSPGPHPEALAVLAAIGDGDPTPPHWSVAIAVADTDATAARAAELGGSVLLGPVDTPGLRSAVVADPQGGVVAVTARA